MNTKSTSFKAGLGFGACMAILNIAFSLIMEEQNTNKEVLIEIVSGLIGGAISGVLFGLLMGWFSKSALVTKSAQLETQDGENIIFSTNANHFKGVEAVGGKLYLTNQRLAFKSHKLNIQNHELSIDLTNIKTIGTYKPMGITNNGLRVITNNAIEKFVVDELDQWIQLLQMHASEPLLINK